MKAMTVFFLIVSFISAIRAEGRRILRSTDQCPQADFLPSVPASASTKHCVSTHHCRRVECAVSGGGHKLTMILKINRCTEPLTAAVTLQQPESNLDWLHTFKDGEKAKLSVLPSSFSGGLTVSNATLYIKVGLKKTSGSNLNYTVAMVGQVTVSDEVDPVNVTLLTGQAPVPTGICDEHVVLTPTKEHRELSPTKKHPKKSGQDQGQCTHLYLHDGTECAVSNHCRKVTCRSPEDNEGPRHVLTLQINGCSKPLTVTVTYTIESSSPPWEWSHTFEDGEKAALPLPPGAGGNREVNPFLKADLKEKSGTIQFKFIMLIETKVHTTNVTFVAGELPLAKCREKGLHQGSHGKWFSKQPTSVNVLVIVIPVVVLVLAGLAVAFYCYRNREGGLRFPIHITPGGSKVPMQRLANEI